MTCVQIMFSSIILFQYLTFMVCRVAPLMCIQVEWIPPRFTRLWIRWLRWPWLEVFSRAMTVVGGVTLVVGLNRRLINIVLLRLLPLRLLLLFNITYPTSPNMNYRNHRELIEPIWRQSAGTHNIHIDSVDAVSLLPFRIWLHIPWYTRLEYSESVFG